MKWERTLLQFGVAKMGERGLHLAKCPLSVPTCKLLKIQGDGLFREMDTVLLNLAKGAFCERDILPTVL